jgi:hypothetical protein
VHLIIVVSTDSVAHSTPPIVTEKLELVPKPKPILREID